jgi:hypothetical protein
MSGGTPALPHDFQGAPIEPSMVSVRAASVISRESVETPRGVPMASLNESPTVSFIRFRLAVAPGRRTDRNRLKTAATPR